MRIKDFISFSLLLFSSLGYGQSFSSSKGMKSFEVSNHLKNITEVVSDRKVQVTNSSTLAYNNPDVISYNDYYPYGMLQENRNDSNQYRFGFQGQEKDEEVKGDGNSINYKYRMHDSRVGRFFAVDPLSAEYSYNSSYSFSENSVINSVELEGLEKVPSYEKWVTTQPVLTSDTYKELEQKFIQLLIKKGFNDYGVGTKLSDFRDRINGIVWSYQEKKRKDFADEIRSEVIDFHAFLNDLSVISVKSHKREPGKIDKNPYTKIGGKKKYGNKVIRKWYDKKVKSININVPYTKANAKKIVNQRNLLKRVAREHMKDRKEAEHLNKTRPLKSFEFYEKKYKKEGYSGNELWEKIILSGTKPNPEVNKKFGIK